MGGEKLQVENGNFTRIVNPLIEALVGAHLNSSEMAVVLFIIRKTYGYNKTEDEISLTQLGKGVNRSRRVVVNAMRKLKLVNIITLVSRGTSKNHSNTWKVNKYIDTWQLGKKSILGKKTVVQLGKKSIHTKDTLTKDSKIAGSPQTAPSKVSIKTKTMRRSDSRHFQDSDEPVINYDTGEISSPIQKQVELRKELEVRFRRFSRFISEKLKTASDIIPEPTPETLARKTYKSLIARKYTDQQIVEIVNHFCTLPKAKEHPTITACFSNDTINSYKRTQKKSPYFTQ